MFSTGLATRLALNARDWVWAWCGCFSVDCCLPPPVQQLDVFRCKQSIGTPPSALSRSRGVAAAGLSWRLPLRELSLRTRCLCVCTCVRACLPVCVCVRVRAKDMIDATGASQRRHLLDCESGCVATAGIDGEGMLLRVRVAVRAPACCVQWTSYVVLSSVLSSVLRPRRAVAPRAPRRFKAPATTQLLPAPQASRTTPQASPARTPAIARAKILKSSPLLGSFLGRIFTSWRPGFSHFHKARDIAIAIAMVIVTPPSPKKGPVP